MSWFKLETSFPTHPKVMGLTANAFRLHVCALAYAAEHLTDGEIDPRTLRILASNSALSRPGRYVNELVKARLWDVNPFETDSYQIHDYGQHQRTKADVEREREQTRQRVRDYRARHGNAVSNALRNGDVTPLVTQQRREEVSIEKGSRPKGHSGATTNVATASARVDTFLRTYCIHLPDEDTVRDELTSRFQLEGQALDEAQEQWRQIRAQARGAAAT